MSFFLSSPLFKSSALAVLLGGLLVGLIALGRGTRDDLKQLDRYTIAFSELEVEPPPGQTREEFLLDVQYYGTAPDKLALLDKTLPGRLAALFGLHPWVEKVEKVEVAPPRRVAVQLTYRRPVLAVNDGQKIRAVDGRGILLPKSASTFGLPQYQGKARPPVGPVGTRWGDAGVEKEAERLARLP